MATEIPIKIQIVKSLSTANPSRIVAVKADGDTAFSLWVTDKTGIPYPLKDLQNNVIITNTDGNLQITSSSTNTNINLASSILATINSALQSGDNISELVNDVGYLVQSDIINYTNEDAQDAVGTILVDTTTIDFTYNDTTPSISADVKLNSIDATHLANNINVSKFTNDSGYITLADVDGTDLTYSSSLTDGTIISSTGSDAIIPLASIVNAGLISPQEKQNIASAIQLEDLANVATSGNYEDLNNIPTTFNPTPHTHPISDIVNLQTNLDLKQDNLVSGTSIKTLEGQSLLGSGNIDLVKADVGLSNVDNTSDSNKPISTAAQTALDGKQATLGYTPENLANKQNSLAVDGSNIKYPTVTAVNAGLALKSNDNAVVHLAGTETITGLKTFSANLIVQADITALTNFKSSSSNIILSDNAGTVFRGTRANAWSDNLNARFFQVGSVGDNIVFTTQTAVKANRFMFHANNTQVSSGNYTTTIAPLGIFEVTNGTSRFFNVFESGNSVFGGGTDDSTNKIQVAGTVSSGTTTAGNTPPTANNQLTRKDYVDTGLGLKANLASPTFTGVPLVPTAPAGTNTTQIATTAFVAGGLATKENAFSKNTGFNKNIGLGGSDIVGATTLLNQYSTTPVDWTATAFNSGQVVFYAGKQWLAKMATVAGDVPAVSSKWEEITFEALANKTVIVDAIPTGGSNNAVSSNGVFDALATKAPISSVHNPVTLGTANGLSLSTQQLSLGLASSGVTGALSGTDWNNFNNKQNALAIVSDAEMQTGTENTKFTTALRIASWFTWIKTQAQTWAAKQTFTLAPRFSSVTASQFLKVDGNKDLSSVSEASDAEMQAGTENTKPITALRIKNWFTWRLTQPFTFGNLAGVGNRVVQVNSSGDTSAPYTIQDGFTTDSDVITALTAATYNSGNNYTATITPANSKVFNQGQFYKNAGVLYFATADNQASRITLS